MTKYSWRFLVIHNALYFKSGDLFAPLMLLCKWLYTWGEVKTDFATSFKISSYFLIQLLSTVIWI